jgi:hypothetical protein
MIDTFDNLEIYCPHLGMMMTFNYCRRAQSALPCRNLLGCWEERIPVLEFLSHHYDRKELEAAFGSLPKSRLERIFENLNRTQQNKT